jgi:hypothetical protein
VKWIASFGQSLRRGARFLRERLRALWGRPRPQRFAYARVDDFPDLLKPSTLYVAGEGAHLWAAAMRCPCGCGDVIELNLLKKVRPRWSVQEHTDGSVSLMPSVWRRKGCRSHFFVRHGRIDWCRSTADFPDS